MTRAGLDKWIEGDRGIGLDAVDPDAPGWRECRQCGEWYSTTSLVSPPHICAELLCRCGTRATTDARDAHGNPACDQCSCDDYWRMEG